MVKRMRNLAACFALAAVPSLYSSALLATIIYVPSDYSTIQEAIDASSSGDTILVSPGKYFENLNFRGKNVFLTSLFYLESDTSYISSTVIDGSNPINADTASCVIFNSGEDSTAVLQGFTLTGGTGTKWADIHGAGTYREGGGILIELSSPTVRHNVIMHNEATNTTGVVSAGGGGIRIGDGNPVIENNVISFNMGRYGPGIVLNYTGCRIRNNVISNNSGGQDYYGGSGIWIYNNLPGKSKIIENNTIVYNSAVVAAGTGGILVWSAINVQVRNNILWGNNSVTGLQIKAVSATPQVTYNDVQFGYLGNGNIDLDPAFADDYYFLDDGSPCIDAGDTAAIYNDAEDPFNPGSANFPSKGGLRNDIGAYGGPGATILPGIMVTTEVADAIRITPISLVYPNPAISGLNIKLEYPGPLQGAEFNLYDLTGKVVISSRIEGPDSYIPRGDLKNGLYLYRIKDEGKQIGSGKIVLQ